jgi:hypothetical protein
MIDLDRPFPAEYLAGFSHHTLGGQFMRRSFVIAIGLICLTSVALSGCLGLNFSRCGCENIKSCTCGAAQSASNSPPIAPVPSGEPTPAK